MPPRYVVGVYVSGERAGKLMLKTTGTNTHFLTSEIQPRTHVWAKYEDKWFNFHVWNIYDSAEDATSGEEELAVLLLQQFDIQTENRRKGGDRQLLCCAIHKLPESLPFPPIPWTLQGKTELPVVRPTHIQASQYLPSDIPISPPRKKVRKIHPAVKSAPKRLLDQAKSFHKKKQTVVGHSAPVSNDNLGILREILTTMYGFQQQIQNVEQKVHEIGQRTEKWQKPMEEISRRFANIQNVISQRSEIIGSTANGNSSFISMTNLERNRHTNSTHSLLATPAVNTATPNISTRRTAVNALTASPTGNENEQLAVQNSQFLPVGSKDTTTVTVASNVNQQLAVQNSQVLPVGSTSTVVVDMIDELPHTAAEAEATVTQKTMEKDCWCRFFYTKSTNYIHGVRTATPRIKGKVCRSRLKSQADLPLSGNTFIGSIRIPTLLYNVAKSKNINIFLRTLCRYSFTGEELSKSSIRGGKTKAKTEYLPLDITRLRHLFDCAETVFPGEFSKDTALIQNRTERLNATLGKTTSAALVDLNKMLRQQFRSINDDQLEMEFEKEFGVSFKCNNISYISIDTVVPDCQEIVGISETLR